MPKVITNVNTNKYISPQGKAWNQKSQVKVFQP